MLTIPSRFLEILPALRLQPSKAIHPCGLLDLRAELTLAGKSDGFQWVDGSFTEDVEVQQGRTPNDVDVVTFNDTAARAWLDQDEGAPSIGGGTP